MSSYFDVLDSDDEGPVQKVAAPAPAAAVSKKAPVGGARRTAGGKSRSSGFTKTQNEGAVTGPRRTDRNREGARGNRGGSRGGGAPRAGKREFDRRGGRPAAGAKGSSEADAVLQSAIEAEALAPTDGETPVADATPQEPEPEDSYVSFDAYMKQVSTEKSGAAFAGEKAARDAKPEAVAGRSHKKDDALPEDDVKALLGSGIAQKSSKKAAKTKATVDSKALGFKSAPKDDRPPRRDDDSRGPRRDGPRRDGDSRGPRRDGPRRDGDSRGPRRDGGAARSGGAARGGAKRAAAPKAGDFPTLGGK